MDGNMLLLVYGLPNRDPRSLELPHFNASTGATFCAESRQGPPNNWDKCSGQGVAVGALGK